VGCAPDEEEHRRWLKALPLTVVEPFDLDRLQMIGSRDGRNRHSGHDLDVRGRRYALDEVLGHSLGQ
jgi:hypothetical protein